MVWFAPFRPDFQIDHCVQEPFRKVPPKPLPISKALVAGRESIALDNSASIRSKTGAPRPIGKPNTLQIIEPPTESPDFSFLKSALP